MADITMCNNLMCPAAGDCKRVQATPSEHWQSCGTWEYTIGSDGVHCEGFYPMCDYTKSDRSLNKIKTE